MRIERHEGGVALLRLEGGKANAMTGAWLAALERLLGEAQAGGASAVVVTGYERFFSAGLALPSLVGLDRGAMRAFIDGFERAMLRVLTYPRPVVAALNGHAVAGGCILALQCDLRVAADADVKLGLSESALGIGLPPLVIESLRLTLGPAALRAVALEGRVMAPRDAAALGLVDEVVAPDALEGRALGRAAELGRAPPAGFAQIKAALRRPVLEALARTGEAERERWLDTWFSPEAEAHRADLVARLASRG